MTCANVAIDVYQIAVHATVLYGCTAVMYR